MFVALNMFAFIKGWDMYFYKNSTDICYVTKEPFSTSCEKGLDTVQGLALHEFSFE